MKIFDYDESADVLYITLKEDKSVKCVYKEVYQVYRDDFWYIKRINPETDEVYGITVVMAKRQLLKLLNVV